MYRDVIVQITLKTPHQSLHCDISAVRTAIEHATDFVHPLKPVVLVRISTVCVCGSSGESKMTLVTRIV